MSASTYGWLHKIAVLIKQLARNNKLANALLFNGIAYSGNEILAEDIIDYLLCLSPKQDSPCLHCDSCLLKDNHPDLLKLSIESKDEDKVTKTSIGVSEVREAINFIALSKHVAKYKIIYIPNLNLLNNNAANALLKSLEEPPANTIFILFTQNISGLLPTIKSRCQLYNIGTIKNSDAKTYLNQLNNLEDTSRYNNLWLSYYNNAPLFEAPITDTNLELLLKVLMTPSITNIFLATNIFDGKKVSFSFILDFILFWCNWLINYRYARGDLLVDGYDSEINRLMELLNSEQLFYFIDEVLFFSPWQKHPLNYKLHIENLLFKYQQVFA